MKKDTAKKIFVTKASLPPYEEYEELIKEIWETHSLTNMGKFHEELKEELKLYLDVSGIELLTNGHLALEMTIQAFDLKGEVITTPFTFASTTHAIMRNGLTPVMCDIKEEDCTIDADKIEALITERTSAILPVHVYGHICDYKKIEEIADRHGLKVIYDAAHAFGETVDGIGVGMLGDASIFSFHATKVFNTIEGGAVTWDAKNDKVSWLGEKLYKFKNFGIMGKESVEYIGGNAKLNEFCAAMGICSLRHVDEWIKERKRVCEVYEERLSGRAGLRLLPNPENECANYAYMPVIFEEGMKRRDAVYEALSKKDIYPRKYFYPCTNRFECYEGILDRESTPVARRISESVLTLPLYPELCENDIERICDVIIKEL